MVHVLVRHKVADYNRWKEVFDSHLNTRKHAGETAFRIFHTVDDPREVVLFFDWESIEQARKFMNSDELRKAMQQAGVEGAPDVQYIEDVRVVHRIVGRLADQRSLFQKMFSRALDTRRKLGFQNYRLVTTAGVTQSFARLA